MDIRAAEISTILKDQISNFGSEAEITEIGKVLSVGDGIARVHGLDEVKAGEMVECYPQGPQGHMFAVVIPKGRDLVAVSSMTRVDEGQQKEMANHMKEDNDTWLEWIHDVRLQLIRTSVDWGIHMGP